METRCDWRQNQLASTFPETFKDFFSMINEDEDHVELISNILEDKIIPRTSPARNSTVNRCSNTRCCNSSTNFGRSNSFRVNRGGNSEFCSHIKHCCLHQNNNTKNNLNLSDFTNSRLSDNDKNSTFSKLYANTSDSISELSKKNSCDNIARQTIGNSGSFCQSSNTTNFYCMLRNSKPVHSRSSSFRGKFRSSSFLENNSASSSSSPVHNIIHQAISEREPQNVTTDQDTARPPKSPAMTRRRASSIAVAEIPFEFQQRCGQALEDQPWGKTTNECNSRETFTSKSPVPFNRAIEGSSIRGENKLKQRMRTSSMPAENNRKPRLADTRRAAIHCADMDMEYYRLRSFSITSQGICNLGDSVKSRRSRSINSVTSTGTSNSGRDRKNSNGSHTEVGDLQQPETSESKKSIPAFKVAMLGSSGVGKTALTYQFTTSEYICAYDLSLDDDYGQKTVSVLLDGQETDLEIIDHPACEMSTEAFCSTYNIDLFVVVYSVVDRKTFKAAEKILHYLKETEMMLTRGVILVGNKTDLERHREVPTVTGRKLAKEITCKFIETSSGLDHNVDELLVGIVAQVKLNSQRIDNLSEKQRLNLTSTTIKKHRRLDRSRYKMSKISSKSSESGSSERNNSTEAFKKVRPRRESLKEKVESSAHSETTSSNPDDNDEDDDNIVGRQSASPSSSSSSSSKSSIGETITNQLSLQTQNSPSCSSSSNYNRVCKSFASNQNKSSRKAINISAKTMTTVSSGESSVAAVTVADEKSVSKISNKTKMFLASFLKFKKTLRVKRRNSNSCSDLFAI